MLSKVIFLEWPLVFFTLFVQGALGLSLFYNAFSCSRMDFSSATADLSSEANSKKYVAVFGITIFLGLFFAVLHLSNPINGYNILFRIFYEVNGANYIGWLPLEVIVLGFTSALAGFIYLLKYKNIKHGLAEKLTKILPLFAFIGIICMVFIYSSKSSTVIAWDFTHTFLLFASTALVLGPLALLALFDLDKEQAQKTVFALVVSYMLFLVVQVLYIFFLANLQVTGIERVFDLAYGYYGCLLAVGLLATLLPVLRLSYLSFYKNACPSKHCTHGTLGLMLFGMICIRILFYAMNNVNMFG